MSAKKNNRRIAALEEILALKGKRRADIIKCAFAIMVVVLVIAGKPLLETMGIIPEGSMIAAGAMFLIAIALAAFAGFASTDYAKCGRRIDELSAKNALTKEDIRAYENL
ncbi:hypothetical protein [Raoultibacter phocaeensis]|uniref:hypothetical protein n=1 Tax=Raoultibacter phocaeensis TaxID=2479841 RepID=UPI00111B7752|nr:hypothetical protein [Raoultibacter phocaeensis]